MHSITVEELAEAFELLDGADRYQYVIDLGKKLEPMPDHLKTDATKVHGCQSNVWIAAESTGQACPPFRLWADSDSAIVKGLAAILVMLHVDQTLQQIITFDHQAVFQELGLEQHLSPNRRNGLRGMLAKVKQIAVEHATS